MKCEIKYAPCNLDEVIYPSVGVERRIKGYASKQLQGHVMLHGSNGTGKSTVARLLIEAIGGSQALVETKHYNSLLSMTDLGEYLQRSVNLANLTSGSYFLLFNEFDKAKKNLETLWTTLDELEDKVMMIITTNHPINIEPSIRSRCDMIDMGGHSGAAVLDRIQYILGEEGLHLPDAQVLQYLTSAEHWMDIRKYMKIADELLYLHRNQMPFPAWKGGSANLKVVKPIV